MDLQSLPTLSNQPPIQSQYIQSITSPNFTISPNSAPIGTFNGNDGGFMAQASIDFNPQQTSENPSNTTTALPEDANLFYDPTCVCYDWDLTEQDRRLIVNWQYPGNHWTGQSHRIDRVSNAIELEDSDAGCICGIRAPTKEIFFLERDMAWKIASAIIYCKQNPIEKRWTFVPALPGQNGYWRRKYESPEKLESGTSQEKRQRT